jgi:ribosome modulation factor
MKAIEIEHHKEAHTRGMRDYDIGKSSRSCPYPDKTGDARAWVAGFAKARTDAQMGKK